MIMNKLYELAKRKKKHQQISKAYPTQKQQYTFCENRIYITVNQTYINIIHHAEQPLSLGFFIRKEKACS